MIIDTPKILPLVNNGIVKTSSSDGTLTDTTVLDTDATLAADSDTRIATQKATKAHVTSHSNLVTGVHGVSGASNAVEGIIKEVTTVTNDYSVLTTDYFICVTVAGKTISLPIASAYTGRIFVIDNASDGDIYLDGESGELIQNETTQTIPSDSAACIYSNGTQWRFF